MINLNEEMAWVTFIDNGWETIWHPVTDIMGKQLMWSEDIMDHCRTQFNNNENWISFGIAPTSQMIIKNSVRNNL
jgi:hypothetical protein|tara:strand:+ start:972 stop:1196 length:225 start_codon:yes stop_codon:yes gene_type:complete